MRSFSIGLLMQIVFLIAIDFAIMRSLSSIPGSSAVLIGLIISPMVIILLLVLRKARTGRVIHLFWLGFEVTGWVAILLLAAGISFFPNEILFPVKWVNNRVGPGPLSLAEMAFLFGFPVVAYTVPQLVVATMVGRFVAAYRVVIERRPSSNLELVGVHHFAKDQR